MKEIKITRTIEEVRGYVAKDGTKFYGSNAKEECEKYENSALCVVLERFKNLVVKELCECEVFENQGYGSEEYMYYLIDIKDENDVNTYNHFAQFTYEKKTIDNSYIGKRILVGVGQEFENWACRTLHIEGTIDDLKKQFAEDMEKVFADKKGDTDEAE